jgi:hypothetical protein
LPEAFGAADLEPVLLDALDRLDAVTVAIRADLERAAEQG